jgi:4-hydroxybenzoate polyprenyltransferase
MQAASPQHPPLGKVGVLLEMIKFQHTVFAMPFALMSMLVASHGRPGWGTLGWIVLAMIGARSSAMTFNRIVDRAIDARNPRTSARALPAGTVSVVEAWVFLLVMTALFVVAAWRLNSLALELSPLALAVIWGYSLSKRFTKWSHALLGLALGVAPVGAWVAVTSAIGFPSVVLSASVVLWVAGFDVIYSLQDIEHDKSEGLHSIPSRWGPAKALMASRVMHLLSAGLLFAFGIVAGLGPIYAVGAALSTILLAYEHSLVSARDFTNVNAAFFTVNGILSIGMLAFTAAAVNLPLLMAQR